MRSSAILTVPMAAVAFAQSSSIDASYTNPFTSFTSMTNSLGVITGMPPINSNVVTSQPLPITTQPAVVTVNTATVDTPVPSVAADPVVPAPMNGTTLVSSVVGGGAAAPTGGAIATGSSGSSGNSTVPAGTRTQPSGSSPTSGSSEESESSPSGETGGAAESASPESGAVLLQTSLGLGFLGAFFAAFL
ncbi:MAG: hypothetical protein LQ341_003063 [Variospora aurantia]|nr:MAG: hypothetical protein LQ341_003063 [Variospora aurantia]